MPTPTFRARTIPELLDAAFQVIRAHYAELAIANAILLFPTAVLTSVLPNVPGIGLLDNLMFIVATGATVLIVSEAYMGREPDAIDVIGRVFRRFLSLWGAALIAGFLMLIGFVLLVIPGFIVWAWTFAMPVVVIVEGRAAGESFERSRELARDNVGRILLALLLTYLLFLAVAFGASVGAGILLAAVGLEGLAGFAGQMVFALVYSFPAVVVTLLYYDLRIRKEAFDLQMLMQQLGEAPAGSVALG